MSERTVGSDDSAVAWCAKCIGHAFNRVLALSDVPNGTRGTREQHDWAKRGEDEKQTENKHARKSCKSVYKLMNGIAK